MRRTIPHMLPGIVARRCVRIEKVSWQESLHRLSKIGYRDDNEGNDSAK